MGDIDYPKRASLKGLARPIFKLVARGATPEQWSEWLRVPLEHAAAAGDIDGFNPLIGAGADGSAGWRGCRGRTLLHAAAVGGNAEVVSGLLGAGAQPDVNVWPPNTFGMRVLYLATSLGHEDAARRLVKAGADVGGRVLFAATQGGMEDLVNDLLIAGASPNNSSPIPLRDPLHIAAQSGNERIVSALLAKGADKDARDDDGGSPLIKAAGSGHLAVANALLASGADVEIRCGRGEYSALDMAAIQGHVGVVKAILGHGADVNAVDKDGGTALHC